MLVCDAVLPSHLAQAMFNYQDTIPRAMRGGNSKMLEVKQTRQKANGDLCLELRQKKEGVC